MTEIPCVGMVDMRIETHHSVLAWVATILGNRGPATGRAFFVAAIVTASV